MNQNNICIIGIYFGKLRNDFPLWLMSCEKNKTIDFLLITDQNIDSYKVPSNIKLISSTLKDVSNLATSKLGIKVNITHPYKLCDFKPVFGLILEDYIKGYEYWGACDFDMVFGDLRSFFDKYNYRDFDHFLTQGHLSLYKNNREVLEYYKLPGSKVGNYRKVFTSDKNYAFDENSGIGSIFLKNNLPMFKKNIYADLSPLYKRLRRSQFNKMDRSAANHAHQVFFWEDGKTFCSYLQNGKVKSYEVLYIHYQKRKFQPIVDFTNYSNGFYILPDQIIPKYSQPEKKDIKNLNPYDFFSDFFVTLSWKYRWVRSRVISRLKKIING